MELQLIRLHSIVILALLSIQMEVLLTPKKFWFKRPEDQYLLLDFNKLSVYTCNKLLDTLFLSILLYGSEIWGAYHNINIKKWEKTL